MELTTAIDWFGVMAGVFGVTIAVYLQLINPRHCHPGHVTALFVGGSALIMVFSAAYTDHAGAVATMKVAAIILFVTLEAISGYFVWKRAEMAPPSEVVRSLFGYDTGGNHG